MGKISDLAGVIGNFFSEGEELSPGQALARVNRSTDSNDFTITALDGAGNQTTFDQAVSYSFGEVAPSNVATVAGAASYSDKITGTATTSAWDFLNSAAGSAVTPIDTDNDARKGATLIDQILEVKTRPAGFVISPTSQIYQIHWLQSDNSIIADTMGGQPSNEFAKMTATTGGRDFGE